MKRVRQWPPERDEETCASDMQTSSSAPLIGITVFLRPPVISLANGRAAWWFGHRSRVLQRLLASAAFLATITMLVGVSAAWYEGLRKLSDERERVRSERSKLLARRPTPKTVEPTLSQSEAAQFNLAVAHLNTPWPNIFNGLENKAQGNIGLTLLEPDAKKNTLRVQAEAKDIDSLLAYAQRLASEPGFDSLVLQQHETNEQDVTRPARLSFEIHLAHAGQIDGVRR